MKRGQNISYRYFDAGALFWMVIPGVSLAVGLFGLLAYVPGVITNLKISLLISELLIVYGLVWWVGYWMRVSKKEKIGKIGFMIDLAAGVFAVIASLVIFPNRWIFPVIFLIEVIGDFIVTLYVK